MNVKTLSRCTSIKSAKPFEDREHVIADIARSVYDYMLAESAGH
jgi:hypothetical protein